jgi:hypothetical protein
MRQGAQDLIIFGLDVYAAHGDAGYLSRLVAQAEQIKGISHSKIKAFITHHANVVWNKDTTSFKKMGKGAAEVKPVAINWWETGKEQDPVKTLKIDSRLDSIAADISGLVAYLNDATGEMDDPKYQAFEVDYDKARDTLKALTALIGQLADAELRLVEAAKAA